MIEMETRVVKAFHGKQEVPIDASYQNGLAAELRNQYSPSSLIEMYGKYMHGDGFMDKMMRRVLIKALALDCGNGLNVSTGFNFLHPETFRIGDGVFLGANVTIQGRYDGRFRIGKKVWVGPHCFFDARDLTIEDYAGIGPGVKMLGSVHTGIPVDVKIIETDLLIKSIVVEEGADIGTGTVVLPGVRIGRHSIVGAGAVVTKDVPEYAVVAGVPARFMYDRREREKELMK